MDTDKLQCTACGRLFAPGYGWRGATWWESAETGDTALRTPTGTNFCDHCFAALRRSAIAGEHADRDVAVARYERMIEIAATVSPFATARGAGFVANPSVHAHEMSLWVAAGGAPEDLPLLKIVKDAAGEDAARAYCGLLTAAYEDIQRTGDGDGDDDGHLPPS